MKTTSIQRFLQRRPTWRFLQFIAVMAWASVNLCSDLVFGQMNPGPYAVLLKNDRVLHGEVEKRGESFVIKIAEASQVVLPRDQVQFIGTSTTDLYNYKLRGMIKPNTGDHFKLTRWCIANDLLDEAVVHYLETSKWDGEHPSVKRLAVELKERLLKVPEFRQYLGLPTSSTNPTDETAVAYASATTVGKQVGETSVVQAGHWEELPPTQAVVAQFSERVQPILLNRCSQAACHGGQTKSPLRIIEPHVRFGTQTSTNNLKSVLAFVPEKDGISPLISYATHAHGIQRRPSIELTESQLIQELRDWIQLVKNPVVTAEGTSPSAPANSEWPEPMGELPGLENNSLSPVQRGSEPRPVPNSSRASTLDKWQPTSNDQGGRRLNSAVFPGSDNGPGNRPAGTNPPQLPPNADTGRQQSVILPGTDQEEDPFDPSAFNLRMHRSQHVQN